MKILQCSVRPHIYIYTHTLTLSPNHERYSRIYSDSLMWQPNRLNLSYVFHTSGHATLSLCLSLILLVIIIVVLIITIRALESKVYSLVAISSTSSAPPLPLGREPASKLVASDCGKLCPNPTPSVHQISTLTQAI